MVYPIYVNEFLLSFIIVFFFNYNNNNNKKIQDLNSIL